MDVGVIGVGAMGRNHARIYSELKNIGLVGVYDQNAARAKEIAVKYGGVAYNSIQELLLMVDAVSICVPTRIHKSVIEHVFRTNKPVLIEKPICATLDEAKWIMENAPPGVTIGVGHIERFNPVVDEIRKIIKTPLYMEMKRHNPLSARVEDITVVEDLMIHDIDILLTMFGEPTEIHSIGTADICTALVKYDSGLLVNISSSRKSSKKVRTISVEEEDFTVEGDLMSQEVIIYSKPGRYQKENERYVQENIIEKVMVNKVEPLRVELQTFLECVKDGKPFPVTKEQAIYNLCICKKIQAGCK